MAALVRNSRRDVPENCRRYPGGGRDADETIDATARRELEEEFDVIVPESALLRPFRVNSTRAIQGRSYVVVWALSTKEAPLRASRGELLVDALTQVAFDHLYCTLNDVF